MREFTEEERRENEERFEKRVREFQTKHFGNRFAGASIAKSDASLGADAQSALSKWLRSNPRNFLVMIGPPGTGKTYMCAALAAEALRRYDTIRCWREENLFARLRESIERYGEYSKTLVDILDDQFCIIDDIGSTPPNDWRKEIIFNTIDIRYALQFPTIITSNYNRQELTEKYEARVTSRLFAKENIIIDLFDMPDMRAA